MEKDKKKASACVFSKKAIIKRVFWLAFILAASAACLYSCIDRIQFLASKPTSTTISEDTVQPLDFPAVTFCNLNFLSKETLNETGLLSPYVQAALNRQYTMQDNGEFCRAVLISYPNTGETVIEDLILGEFRHMDMFISNCSFKGIPCARNDFVPVVTTFGLCYTFNSGSVKEVLQVEDAGGRQGLAVSLHIDQEQYVASPNFDAGIRVVVHSQSEPPLPVDQGIAVSPGSSAVIGLTRRNIVDKTERNCRPQSDLSGLNFLRRDFDYTVSACSLDCFLTQVADRCNCSYLSREYAPDTPFYSSLRRCTMRDICCIELESVFPRHCECKAECERVQYTTSASYAVFPADYIVHNIEQILGVPFGEAQDNFIAVNVYYQTANVETVTTTSAYTVISLLSDAGGLLGLFLGLSIISVLDFVLWFGDKIEKPKSKEKEEPVDKGEEANGEIKIV